MTVEFIAQVSPDKLDLGPFEDKPTATTEGVREATHALWTSGSKEVGFWECTPGTFTARRDGYTEMCQILAGSVTIETDGGDSVRLSAGDTIVMPSGWVGTWHVHETLKKTYVTIAD